MLKPTRYSNLFGSMSNLLEPVGVEQSLEDLFDCAFGELQPKTQFPKINVSEADEVYTVEIAIAGYDKSDLELELKDNMLCIDLSKKKEDPVKYLIKEISHRKAKRYLKFPVEIDTSSIETKYADGIVTCILKKKQIESVGPIKVKIN